MQQLFIPLLVAVTAAVLLQLTPSSAGYYGGGSACGYNRSHNFFYGRKSYYDRLLYSNRTLSGGRYGTVRVDVEFPPRRQPARGVISYIEVLDNYRDGLGACAYLGRGGPGMRNATITLMSSNSHPIDSTINVYGA